MADEMRRATGLLVKSPLLCHHILLTEYSMDADNFDEQQHYKSFLLCNPLVTHKYPADVTHQSPPPY